MVSEGENQCSRSRDLGGRHGAPADKSIGAVAQCRVDIHSGSSKLDGLAAVVARGPQVVILIAGRRADLIRTVVNTGIARGSVVVLRGISCRGDKQNVIRAESIDLV